MSESHAHEQVEHAPSQQAALPAERAVPAARARGLLRLQRAAGNAAVSRMLSRQEQNLTPAQPPPPLTPANAQPGDFAKLTWEQLLPTAHGAGGNPIAKVDLHIPPPKKGSAPWGTGEDPTLKYGPEKDIKVDPAKVEPKGGASTTPQADAEAAAQAAAFESARETAVKNIIAARAKIPVRAGMGRSLNNNAGWDYNPDKDPASADYRSWERTALPTDVKATDWNWKIFKKIQGLEGQTGRVTTYDKTLSVGAGFSSSGGQTQTVIGNTFDQLPEVKAMAFAAGLIVSGSKTIGMVVVDTDKKWILHENDADAYIQTQTQLISLIVDVSQGALPTGTGSPDEQAKQRQTWLDVQWKQFTDGTLADMTSLVRGWPEDSIVLAAHAKHSRPDHFPYSFWKDHPSSDLAKMVLAIYARSDAGPLICTGIYGKFPTSPAPAPPAAPPP